METMEGLVSRIENWEPPSAMKMCALVLASYFAITAGIAYDIINEPPSMGGVQDPVSGKVIPQTFMPYRMNGQYIIEGLVGAMMYSIGGLGLIALHMSHSKKVEAKYRPLILYTGCVALIVSFASTRIFMQIKMPSYLRESN